MQQSVDSQTVTQLLPKLVEQHHKLEVLYQSQEGQLLVQYLQVLKSNNEDTINTMIADLTSVNLQKLGKLQGENAIIDEIINLPEELKKFKVAPSKSVQ